MGGRHAKSRRYAERLLVRASPGRGHRDQSLQVEWNARGEQDFEYEILELLDPDVAPVAVSDLLKEKKRYWMAQLTALPLC